MSIPSINQAGIEKSIKDRKKTPPPPPRRPKKKDFSIIGGSLHKKKS